MASALRLDVLTLVTDVQHSEMHWPTVQLAHSAVGPHAVPPPLPDDLGCERYSNIGHSML